jgi:hypothetical protein
VANFAVADPGMGREFYETLLDFRFGRTPKLTEHQRGEAIKRLQAGETQQEIGKLFNVSHQTIGRLHRQA